MREVPEVKLDDVRDPNFTAGLDPVEYLRRLHEGEPMPTADERIVALTARLTALEAAMREAHQELYGNASVSVEFAGHDLDPENAPFNLAKVRGFVREARVSISTACSTLARALASEGP